MSKILAVGDIHAEWGKLNTLINDKQPDIILQCGDFGWWPSMESREFVSGDKWRLAGVKAQNTRIYWCDGNHEDHYALGEMQLRGYPVEQYPGVVFCPRGSTIELPDGRIVLFYGGAASVDKAERTYGFDWFPEEIPNGAEFRRAGLHDRVDIIISHTCPLEFVLKGHIMGKEDDPTRQDLSMLLARYQPKEWYFGHWHNFKQGQYGRTKWTALSHPSAGSKWWIPIRSN